MKKFFLAFIASCCLIFFSSCEHDIKPDENVQVMSPVFFNAFETMGNVRALEEDVSVAMYNLYIPQLLSFEKKDLSEVETGGVSKVFGMDVFISFEPVDALQYSYHVRDIEGKVEIDIVYHADTNSFNYVQRFALKGIFPNMGNTDYHGVSEGYGVVSEDGRCFDGGITSTIHIYEENGMLTSFKLDFHGDENVVGAFQYEALSLCWDGLDIDMVDLGDMASTLKDAIKGEQYQGNAFLLFYRSNADGICSSFVSNEEAPAAAFEEMQETAGSISNGQWLLDKDRLVEDVPPY